MFLVGDSLDRRERNIRSWMSKQPSVALVVAAVYFEWMLCRAIIALSRGPNKQVRHSLERVHGLPAYKDVWRAETKHLAGAKTLPHILANRWEGVTKAFNDRNVLVHGRDRYTRTW